MNKKLKVLGELFLNEDFISKGSSCSIIMNERKYSKSISIKICIKKTIYSTINENYIFYWL